MPRTDRNPSTFPDKYRPRRLRDIKGQKDVVSSLASFANTVFRGSGRFIFHGPPGVGMTAAARAFAWELGCAVEWEELGGVYEIPSGTQDGRAVENLLRSLHLLPL